MGVLFNPYLNFNGNTKEVLEYYHDIFGGELTMTKFSEQPGMEVPVGYEDKIMHGQLSSPDVTIMASEAQPGTTASPGSNFALSLSGDDKDKLTSYFEKLSDGGKVDMPLAQAPWGDWFGMFDDKFGISWMVNITPKAE